MDTTHHDPTREGRAQDIIYAVLREQHRAVTRYPAYHSTHEGYAVIAEELDELWDRVKAGKRLTGDGLMAVEAIQVMSAALRFVLDLCDPAEVAATLRNRVVPRS